MKQVWLWFWLSCKRYMRRGIFSLILLLLPAAALAFPAGRTEDDRIGVAVYAWDQKGLGRQLADRLVSRQEEGMFRFFLCTSEEEVEAQVASGAAECGYVIYEGLEEKLDRKELRRVIGLYKSPSTVAGELSSEVVFGELITLYNKELLKDYVTGGQDADPERLQAAVRAGELYDEILTDGSTFSFEYVLKGREKDGSEEIEEASLFPVRGLGAVLVFGISLYSAVALGEDERRGMFLPVDYSRRLFCRLAALLAPGALAACSLLVALAAGGVMGNPVRELGLLAAYVLLTGADAWILKVLCRTPEILCCVIPFMLMGSLIFCPVFLDLEGLLQEMGWVGRLFLPYYYLKLF